MTETRPAAPPDGRAATPPDVIRARGRAWARRFLSLQWVPLAAALLSLPLSAFALYLTVQQPQVTLIMPDQVRVAQGRQSGAAYVYLQPAFVSTGANDRVEVIGDMALEVVTPAGETVSFAWTQQLRLVDDGDGTGLSYEYVADAIPLLISPRQAAAPLALFNAPAGWHFAAGRHTVRLVADRVVTGQPLSESFALDITQANIDFLEQPGPELFLTFPTQ